MKNPVEQLSGRTTESGWTVLEAITRKDYQSGGCFSVGYRALGPDNKEGFLKAFDLSTALRSPEPMQELEALARTFNFEKELLERLGTNRNRKIVVALDSGDFDIEDAPLGKVFYIIFELADGDIRKHIHEAHNYNILWAFSSLHHITMGLQLMHSKNIIHQDLKPSNVLVFKEGETSKLADLGRAFCSHIESPHDNYPIPGDLTYAPIEQIYTLNEPNTLSLRIAGDLYLLGSMMRFLPHIILDIPKTGII